MHTRTLTVHSDTSQLRIQWGRSAGVGVGTTGVGTGVVGCVLQMLGRSNVLAFIFVLYFAIVVMPPSMAP
jgi:hypothetical protein